MAKQNRMHVVALQTTIGKLAAEKLALQVALDELGYCHDQQTAFITASMSGADGLICKDILLAESKAALAEAVKVNSGLTSDAEFQSHRYKLQAERLAQTARCAADLTERVRATERRLGIACRVVVGLGLALFAVLVAGVAHGLAVVL